MFISLLGLLLEYIVLYPRASCLPTSILKQYWQKQKQKQKPLSSHCYLNSYCKFTTNLNLLQYYLKHKPSFQLVSEICMVSHRESKGFWNSIARVEESSEKMRYFWQFFIHTVNFILWLSVFGPYHNNLAIILFDLIIWPSSPCFHQLFIDE